jgi:nucleolar protein 15
MKSYFSQFGKVTRLRVSRNKKTGAPKHYAFVEFASSEVAEIVAKTMDKYLMFGHILQCRVIPSEQVHPNLFVGANQRYKRIPRNKMAGNEMLRGAERAVWEKRVEKETKKRAKKNKKLQEKLGYEYKAPELKSVEDVPKKAAALEDAPGTQLLTELDAAAKETPAQIEEAKTEESAAAAGIELKKSNKTTKRKAEATAETADTAEKHEASEQKPKKSKKAKVEPNAQRDDAPPEEVKTKKAKKVTKGEAEEDLPKEKKRKSLSSTDVAGAKSKKTKKSKA